MRARLADLLAGARLLLRGFGTWAKDPGLMALGAVPALIVGAAMLALVVVVALHVEGWAVALSPWAAAWHDLWSGAVRFAIALGILVGTVVLCVLSFAAITLAVGEPFYERIRQRVDERLGAAPEAPERGFWAGLGSGLRDALVLLLMAAGTALVVLVAGLVPLIGTALGLVLGAVLGGRALSRELTGLAGEARGLTLAERRALLASRPWRSLGFGIAAYLVLLVPGLAVVATPVAIVGATLLVRDLRGEATTAPERAA